MEVRKIRDLTLITLDEKRTMVIACDSCGGVGMKEGDELKVPPFFVGKFAARVPLLEVMCTGAEVVTITDTVSNEMEPTGAEIISGIKEELMAAGIKDIVLTGSTEENFKTSVTALGTTVVGLVNTNELKVNNIKTDALLISIGLPKVGGQINFVKDDEIVDYPSIKNLLKADFVYEIVPVGSKGIAYEAEQLAINNKLRLKLDKNIIVDINKSGGPATCVIAAIDRSSIDKISETISNINIIGYLEGE